MHSWRDDWVSGGLGGVGGVRGWAGFVPQCTLGYLPRVPVRKLLRHRPHCLQLHNDIPATSACNSQYFKDQRKKLCIVSARMAVSETQLAASNVARRKLYHCTSTCTEM